MSQPIDFDNNAPISADEYDRTAQLALPGYEAMHTMVLACLQAYLPESADLLVVGSGTGMELTLLGKACPQWHFLGIDPSEKMQAIAKEKMSHHQLSQRVKLIQGYTHSLPTDILYNAATSILVMHFIPPSGKLEFLQSIAQRLHPSAPFVLVDIFGEKQGKEFKELMPILHAYWNAMGLPPQKQQELLTGVDQGVYPLPETSILNLLEQAGFEKTMRFYTGLWVGGWLAFKK
ncbi:MAG: class I SAM-dependent methyltransferase [Hassallia sp.]